jgi:hypothetical protein
MQSGDVPGNWGHVDPAGEAFGGPRGERRKGQEIVL